MMNRIKQLNQLALYFFIFCIPWQTRLIWEEFTLNNVVLEFTRSSLFGWQIVLWFVLITHGILLLKNRRQKISIDEVKRKVKQPHHLAYFLLLITTVVSALSVIWSIDASIALYRFFVFAQVGALLAYLLTGTYSLIKVAIIFVSAAVLQSCLAIWQFFIQYIPANKWLGLAEHISSVPGTIILETVDQRWMRAYGSLPHPNMLGGFLLVGILLLLWLSLRVKKYTHRILLFTATIITTTGLFFSFSRSAWIATVITCAISLMYTAYKKEFVSFAKQGFIVLVSCFTLIALLGIFGDLAYSRIFPSTELEYTSIDLRLTFGQQALTVIQNNPIGGVGIGNYILGVHQFVNSMWPGWYYQAVHNIYLLSVAELGFIGGGVFILALVVLVVGTAISKLSSSRMVLTLPFIGLLIIGITDHYLWTIEFGLVLLFIAIAFSMKAIKGTV